MKPHQEYLMDFITQNGREQGAAFLQSFILWLDYNIECEFLDQHNESYQNNIMGQSVRDRSLKFARVLEQKIRGVEERVYGLTEQDSKIAKKEAQAIVEKNIKKAIETRNNVAELLKGFPESCEVIESLKIIKTFTIKSEGQRN